MSLFIEFHLIQNFAPSNLNRDDTGAPKDAIFGGHRRARVSSQCWKKCMRDWFKTSGSLDEKKLGVRTRFIDRVLTDALTEAGIEDVGKFNEIVKKAFKVDEKKGGKSSDEEGDNDKENQGDASENRLSYLLFVSAPEIDALKELISGHAGMLKNLCSQKKIKPQDIPKDFKAELAKVLAKSLAADIALFGRMLADLPAANQNAACQVAHAISTHRVEREFDYFTAIDERAKPDEASAGMIAQVEFNSATFYRYLVLNASQLLGNLQGDRDLTLASVDALVQAAVRAIPTGKQNSFAAQNLPTFVGISVRSGSPLSLANAFEKPIVARHDRSLTEASVAAMADYETRLAAQYGQSGDQWAYLDLTGAWPADKGAKQTDLTALAAWARAQADKGLGA